MRANDINVAHVAADRASAIDHRAGLNRSFGLRKNSDGVRRAAKKRRGEGKIYVTRAADDEIVTAIVLQRESCTVKSLNRTANRENWRRTPLYTRAVGGCRASS